MLRTEHLLRLRIADDEWAARISRFLEDLANHYARRPDFVDVTASGIEDFLLGVLASKIQIQRSSIPILEKDAAGWTGYTHDLVFDDLNLGADLATAAFERFSVRHNALLVDEEGT